MSAALGRLWTEVRSWRSFSRSRTFTRRRGLMGSVFAGAFEVDGFDVFVDRSPQFTENEGRERQACSEGNDQYQRNRYVESCQRVDGKDDPRGDAYQE